MVVHAWLQRAEPLGFFVAPHPEGVHRTPGDGYHRIVTRSSKEPLLVRADVHTSLRVPVAFLSLGRRVGCFVEDPHDIERMTARISRVSSGVFSSLPVAIWNEGDWHSCLLNDLLTDSYVRTHLSA